MTLKGQTWRKVGVVMLLIVMACCAFLCDELLQVLVRFLAEKLKENTPILKNTISK